MKDINISSVYCITNKITEKQYVGSTSKSLGARKRQHLYELKHDKHPSKLLQKDFNLYGEDSLVFYILEKVKTFDRDELFGREQFWINKYNPEYNTVIEVKNGFSRKARSKEAKIKQGITMTGRKQSPETIAKRVATMQANGKHKLKRLSEEQKNHLSEINTGERNPSWGLKRTDETKSKMSKSNSKIEYTFSKHGSVHTFINLTEFCRNFQLDYWKMRQLYRGKSKKYSEWNGWKFVSAKKLP